MYVDVNANLFTLIFTILQKYWYYMILWCQDQKTLATMGPVGPSPAQSSSRPWEKGHTGSNELTCSCPTKDLGNYSLDVRNRVILKSVLSLH